MKSLWMTLALALGAGQAYADESPLPEVQWTVSAQFPQYRERLRSGESRWRTPAINGAGIDGAGVAADVLPLPDETWDQWYDRISVGGQSPYAEWIGSAHDVWLERLQRYDPGFLAYIQSDKVFVRIARPAAVPTGNFCRWQVDGQPLSSRLGCEPTELLIPTTGATVSLLVGGREMARSVVRPKRLVVLGLGDSYASGEGNPDRPTEWYDRPVRGIDWLILSREAPNPYVRETARWRDPRCHRSFWNHQNFTAMRLAAENPHREVDFLQFACSGAEVLDGMLVRQLNPPGISERDKSGCTAGRAIGCRIRTSQLSAAVSALCLDRPGEDDLSVPDGPDALIPRLDRRLKTHSNGQDRWQKLSAYREGKRTTAPYGLDLLECTSRLRTPDLVLLSIGGNDAGFGNLVAWAVMPSGGRTWIGRRLLDLARALAVICPADVGHHGCARPYAPAYAQQLVGRLDMLALAMKEVGLAPDARRVVMSSYPNPLRMRQTGTGAPQLCSDPIDRDSPWEALKISLPHTLRKRDNWNFYLRNEDGQGNARAAKVMDEAVLPQIWAGLREGAVRNGFTFVPEAQAAFRGRSWCDEPEAELARLALPSRARRHWNNASPASWRPYARRARAIRTANDSYLTQLSMRSGDKNGVMHPTAEGQTLIAAPIYLAAHTLLQTLDEPAMSEKSVTESHDDNARN